MLLSYWASDRADGQLGVYFPRFSSSHKAFFPLWEQDRRQKKKQRENHGSFGREALNHAHMALHSAAWTDQLPWWL